MSDQTESTRTLEVFTGPCAICLGTWCEGEEEPLCVLPCRHAFGLSCFQKLEKTICPMCRRPFAWNMSFGNNEEKKATNNEEEENSGVEDPAEFLELLFETRRRLHPQHTSLFEATPPFFHRPMFANVIPAGGLGWAPPPRQLRSRTIRRTRRRNRRNQRQEREEVMNWRSLTPASEQRSPPPSPSRVSILQRPILTRQNASEHL